jgi:hypothetical protein
VTTPEDELDRDPADREEKDMTKAMDAAGVPRRKRARNAGGTMSETERSRSADVGDSDARKDSR